MYSVYKPAAKDASILIHAQPAPPFFPPSSLFHKPRGPLKYIGVHMREQNNNNNKNKTKQNKKKNTHTPTHPHTTHTLKNGSFILEDQDRAVPCLGV